MTARRYVAFSMVLGALLVCAPSVPAQLSEEYVAPFPRPGVLKLKETDAVTFWEVLREKGKPSPMYRLPLDQLEVTLNAGAVKFTKPDGTWRVEQQRWGTVRLVSKGTVVQEEGLSDIASRAVVFQLKEFQSRTQAPIDGIPGQFPRIGAEKLFENERINVWEQGFLLDRAITNHLHYTETAAVFLVGGKLRTRSLGQSTNPPFERHPGELLGGGSPGRMTVPHEEELVEGSPRIIWVEFK